MGFSITQATEAPSGTLTSDRRLFLTANDTLVEEGDVTARVQLCAPGHVIPGSEARRLGLSVEDGKVVQRSPDPAEQETAGRTPDENKQRAPGETKGAGKK